MRIVRFRADSEEMYCSGKYYSFYTRKRFITHAVIYLLVISTLVLLNIVTN